MPLGSFIGGALGLMSNFATSFMNQQNVENTNAVNRQAIERQNQLNLEQWQRENAYNAPINQIQRLRAAGLNPGIMYGSGGVVNSSAPSPAMQSSRDVPPQSTFQVDPLTAAQIANIDADTKGKEDANERANQLQSVSVEISQQNLEHIKTAIQSLQQDIKNAAMDEQAKSIQYLQLSTDYQRSLRSFEDSVQLIHEAVNSSRLRNKYSLFELDRAVKLLPLELAGYDLSNKKIQSAINLDMQAYRQSEELFKDVKELKGLEVRNSRADASLKELQFWIDAIDNPIATDNYNGIHDTKLQHGIMRSMDAINRLPILRWFKK